MKLSDKAVFRPSHGPQVGDETVILDLASGTYFGLDPVGARIWALMGEGKTLAESARRCWKSTRSSESSLRRMCCDWLRNWRARPGCAGLVFRLVIQPDNERPVVALDDFDGHRAAVNPR